MRVLSRFLFRSRLRVFPLCAAFFEKEVLDGNSKYFGSSWDSKYFQNIFNNTFHHAKSSKQSFALGAGVLIQPSTVNLQPLTLNPQPSTLNPQPSTLNPPQVFIAHAGMPCREASSSIYHIGAFPPLLCLNLLLHIQKAIFSITVVLQRFFPASECYIGFYLRTVHRNCASDCLPL